MSHRAAAAINAWLIKQGSTSVTQSVLDGTQRLIISPALISDAQGMFYSAVVTAAEALKGVAAGQFSWATVKLYYAAFYSVRVLLAMNDVAIFYPKNGKPYSLRVVAGEAAKKEKGVTHKVVWSVLKAQLPGNPLLGAIGQQSASEWLMNIREDINYRTPRFSDPIVPPHFSALDRLGIARAVAAYIADTSFLYAFDSDHAVLAFPLECLRSAGVALRRNGAELDASDGAHVRSCLAGTGVDPSSFLEMGRWQSD